MSHISPTDTRKTVLLKPGHTDTLTNGHFQSPLLKTSKPQNQSKPKTHNSHNPHTHAPIPFPIAARSKKPTTENNTPRPHSRSSTCFHPKIVAHLSSRAFLLAIHSRIPCCCEPSSLLFLFLLLLLNLPCAPFPSFLPSFLPSFFLSFFVSLVPCFPAGLPLLALAVGVVVAPAFPFLPFVGTLDCLRNLCNGTQGQRRWAEAPTPPNKMVGNS
jgi:hypothetical protein